MHIVEWVIYCNTLLFFNVNTFDFRCWFSRNCNQGLNFKIFGPSICWSSVDYVELLNSISILKNIFHTTLLSPLDLEKTYWGDTTDKHFFVKLKVMIRVYVYQIFFLILMGSQSQVNVSWVRMRVRTYVSRSLVFEFQSEDKLIPNYAIYLT